MPEVGVFITAALTSPLSTSFCYRALHKCSIPDNLSLCVSLPILCFYTPPLCSFLLSLVLPKPYLSIVLSESEV